MFKQNDVTSQSIHISIRIYALRLSCQVLTCPCTRNCVNSAKRRVAKSRPDGFCESPLGRGILISIRMPRCTRENAGIRRIPIAVRNKRG